jgi:hypothetical protein
MPFSNASFNALSFPRLAAVWGALLVGLAWGIPAAQGQITEFSPYSRNGLGLLSPSTTAGLIGLAGSGTAAAPAGFINTENPAAIAGLLKTTLEVGGSSVLQELKLGEDRADGTFGQTTPISLAVKRQGGKSAFNLGIAPYSSSGFAATRTYSAEGIGLVRETYDGEGGLTQLQLGLARSFERGGWIHAGTTDSIKVQKHQLFLGARLRYVFGQIQRTTRLDILDPTFLDNRTRTTDQHRSPGLELGMQYEWLLHAEYNDQLEFQRSTSLRFGATFAPEAHLSTDQVRTVETTQTLGGIVTPLDTAFFNNQTAASGRIPSRIGLGGALHFNNGNGRRFAIIGDWVEQDWSAVATEQSVQLLTEGVEWDRATALRMGVEWTPARSSQRTNVWSLSTYRLGAASGTLGMAFNGEPLTYETLNAGLSIPLLGSRSSSQFHFGTEFGTRTTANEGALEERYIRFQFGLSLSPFLKNNWLIPRLYD